MRFAVIDMFDCIIFESNNVIDCYEVLCALTAIDGNDSYRGIYDYDRGFYLDLVDIIDLEGVQIHSED